MKRGWIVLGVVVLLLVISGGSMISTRNNFVTMEVEVKARWAQVDNQLQRRNDLIPNLVETVKGFATQERTVFESIANARAKMAGASSVSDRITASNEMSSALARLLVVVENYPQLKSNENFTRLMDELAGTENRLSVERKRYNDAVQAYDTAIRMFPGSVVASLFGFKEQPYFEVPAAARQLPQVKFQ